jgi:predicted DNA-binding protein (UPF0251 family)
MTSRRLFVGEGPGEKMPKKKPNCDHFYCHQANIGECLDGVQVTSDDLRVYRHNADMTQEEAAKMVYKSGGRVWRRWEAGERRIDNAAIHLFALLTDQKFPPRRDAA